MKIIVTVIGLLLSVQAFAAIPVMDGQLAKVKSVRLISNEGHPVRPPVPSKTTVVARIEYNGGCDAPASFVVLPGPQQFQYQVLEARTRAQKGAVHCMAIIPATTDVVVATFFEITPDPAAILVNGMRGKP